MANGFFNNYKALLLTTGLNISSLAIKAALIDETDWTPNFSTDQDLADVTGTTVATSGNLGSKTTTNGVFDAADVTFTSVSGDAADGILLYYDSGVAATSTLICYMNTGVTGLPVTPNGGDITITWNASGIFNIATV